MKNHIYFKPKVDIALIIIPVLFCLPTVVFLLAAKDNSSLIVFFIFLALFTFALISLFLSFKYYIDQTEQTLVVKSFFGRRRIPLKNITSITKSGSLLAAPAPSLDRLKIHVASGRSGVLVSPVDKSQFATELLKFNDSIEIGFKL